MEVSAEVSNAARVWKVLKGIFTILCCVLMVEHPDDGFYFVVLLLDITLLVYGFRLLLYYFRLARYMVGGIMTLYKSIVVIDFGLFIFSLSSMPQKYVMLYLIISYVFYGATDIIDAVGAKKLGSASWRFQLFYGCVKVIAGLVCVFYLDDMRMVTLLYCIALVYSAVSDIISAFRKTAIVYIE